MGSLAHASCESARYLPQRFAHTSMHIPESQAILRAEPFPGELSSPVTSSRPSSTCKAHRRRRLPHSAPLPGAPDTSCDQIGCCIPPSSPNRPAHIAIADLFLPGVYASQVLEWFALADLAAIAIRKGRHPPSVPTRVIGQHQLQPWARGIIWDCRDPTQCHPVQRSTRHTSFPPKPGGEPSRQIHREAIRRIAAILKWHDLDIVDQIGEGGVEVRSDCSLDIVLVFHHQSLLQEMAMAEKSVQAHVEEGWVAPPVRHLPFVPCRLQPRGVVKQQRTRLQDDGITLEEYEKPRITTDSSFGGADSVNAGVADLDRSVILPSIQSLGRGWAICQSAFAPSLTHAHRQPAQATPVRGYCIDAETAYSFCPIQQADLWTQCLCWWDSAGSAGVATDYRMGFGGAFAPNRFERISTLVAAFAQHLQAEFDSTQPLPALAQAFVEERRALQRLGKLPPGEAQCHPRFLQVFMDDFTGAATSDEVTPPASIAHILVENEHMIAAGCTPAPTSSRVHVHARLTILALSMCGLYAAPHKVACGSPLPALGLLVDGDASCIRCPAGKRRAVLASIASQHLAAQLSGAVDRARARRLVGQLCNLSQVAPELRDHLHAGYTVSEASWPGSGGSRGIGHMSLRLGSDAHVGWLTLLAHSTTILTANSGVQLAHQLIAPSRLVPGTLTSITDASGEDGLGGYGFLPEHPKDIFILSEPWPQFALTALQASSSEEEAALRRVGSSSAKPYLAMPAAELFTQLVLPAAVARLTHLHTVFSVGDCEPSALVVGEMHSRNSQMRSLVASFATPGTTWIGAHVPREANLDADRLSHPSQLPDVVRDAKATNLNIRLLSLEEADCSALQLAITATAAPSRPNHRKRHKPPPAIAT
jgi:hypothetical protein